VFILCYGSIVATMPEVEIEAPPAYSPYESDVTTSQTGADTDSSNLTSHIGELDDRAWKVLVYCFVDLGDRKARSSTDIFKM
jgi:hypothetical protein